MNNTLLPPVLKSRLHLNIENPFEELEKLPISSLGTTYAMVQELTWLDENYFAVGRWDGTLSIFNFTNSATEGPVVSEAINTPSAEGVQMITWLAPGIFASSNDNASVIVWQKNGTTWDNMQRLQTLSYDASLGIANSGASYNSNNHLYFIIGHETGFISIWTGSPTAQNLQMITAVDLRSPHPVNPWNIHNIRGVSVILWNDENGYVVTGSEDGNLCVVRIPDGTVMSCTVYNPKAKRGINSITAFGQNLLVANCSVGPADNNLWYYWIDSNNWSIQTMDAARLQVDGTLQQVFNFDVIWGFFSGGVCWYSTTEEGYLWMGLITNQKLSILGNVKATSSLGAAIGMSSGGNLALAAYDLYQFTTANSSVMQAEHPERFTIASSNGLSP